MFATVLHLLLRYTQASSSASKRSLWGLDWLNFFLADVQSGVGPFLAIYLAGSGWNQQTIGIALTGGGIAGIIAQTPAGALADRVRSKRALVAGGVIALAVGAFMIALYPSFWPVIPTYTARGVEAMRTAFVPPKANELDITARSLMSIRAPSAT
jgi:MFS family permease